MSISSQPPWRPFRATAAGRGRRLAGTVAVIALLLAGCSRGSDTTNAQPTVVTSSSAVASPFAPGTTPGSASPLQIGNVIMGQGDAAIVLQELRSGASDQGINLQGWTLQVGDVSVQLPSDLKVNPGETLVLHAGPVPAETPQPGSTAGPPVSGSPSPAVGSVVPAPDVPNRRDVFIGPSAAPLLARLTSAAQLKLVDRQNIIASQYTIP